MLPIDHYAKPETKGGKQWMLTAAKTIESDFFSQNHSMFAKNGGKYDENRLYAINKPPINKFKKLRDIAENAVTSELAVDWTFRGPGAKFVDMMVEKVLTGNYSPVATPIDPTSRDEQNKYIADMRAKLLMQQSLQQAGVGELGQMPQLKMKPTDPKNMEELEMRLNSGEQFNRAIAMELLIQLAFWNNRVPQVLRPEWVKDATICGAGVYKDDVGPNGDPVAVRIDPAMFGCSFCEQPDFSDNIYAFQLLQVPVGTLSGLFDADEFKEIKLLPNRGGLNNFRLGQIGDDLRHVTPKPGHVLVMDFELFTWDDYHWEIRTSSFGNVVYKEVTKERAANGTSRPKYEYQNKTTKTVLRGKWIVGTQYIYEYGVKPNQKREYADSKRMGGCTLSFKPFAVNMHKMICSSMVDRLKPAMDDYMANNIAIQNMVNKMVPNGFIFDLDALEAVNMTMGGQAMTVEKLIKLFYKTGQGMIRSSGMTGANPNAKAIEAVQNEDFGSLVALINRQATIIQEMRDTTGLNEITDGSTPAERTGVGVANLANSATNTALRPLIRMDEFLLTELGYDMYLRTQQAIRMNPDYGGYIPGINKGTWRFVKADADMPKRQYAIMLEMRATDDTKAMLMQYFQETFAAGLLDPGDLITLLNTHNLEMAQQIWSYKIQKNQQRMAQEKQDSELRTFQGQAESAERAEAAKQKTGKLIGVLEYKKELAITKRILLEANIKVSGTPDTGSIAELDSELQMLDQALAMDEQEGEAAEQQE